MEYASDSIVSLRVMFLILGYDIPFDMRADTSLPVHANTGGMISIHLALTGIRVLSSLAACLAIRRTGWLWR